jgi:hypothetical protein
MKEILNIILLLVLGIAYLTINIKVQTVFFNKLSPTRNNSITYLFLASLLASGIVLIDISKSMSDAYSFFYDKGQIGMAGMFQLIYVTCSLLLSWGLFHFSFVLTSMITKENEKIELQANNIELSLIHGVILLVLSFLIGPALNQLANSLIPYPELPF